MSEATRRPAIRGIVAEVVSDRELIINRGAAHGVTEDMYFKVMGDEVRQVVDPETGEELGRILSVKVVVQAYEVADRFTIARTFRERRINVGGQLGSPFASMLTPPKYEYQVETLKRDPAAGQPINQSDSLVSKGDSVVEIGRDEAHEARTITLYR